MAASESATGSKGILDMFLAERQTDGTIEVMKADGSGPAAAPADAVYRLEEIEQTQIQPQDDTTFKLALTHYDCSEDFVTNVLNVYAKAYGSAGGPKPATWWKENGTQRGAATSTDKLLLVIHYGNDEPNGAGKVLVHASVLVLAKSSGGVTYQAGQWLKPAYSGSSVAPTAETTLLEEIFDPAIIKAGAGGIGDQILRANEHYLREYLKKAA